MGLGDTKLRVKSIDVILAESFSFIFKKSTSPSYGVIGAMKISAVTAASSLSLELGYSC